MHNHLYKSCYPSISYFGTLFHIVTSCNSRFGKWLLALSCLLLLKVIRHLFTLCPHVWNNIHVRINQVAYILKLFQLIDQVAFVGARTEMKDILSIIAEFYLSKNSTKWRKLSLLVPQFHRYLCSSTHQHKNWNLCFFCFNQNFIHFEAYTVIWMLLDA